MQANGSETAISKELIKLLCMHVHFLQLWVFHSQTNWVMCYVCMYAVYGIHSDFLGIL